MHSYIIDPSLSRALFLAMSQYAIDMHRTVNRVQDSLVQAQYELQDLQNLGWV